MHNEITKNHTWLWRLFHSRDTGHCNPWCLGELSWCVCLSDLSCWKLYCTLDKWQACEFEYLDAPTMIDNKPIILCKLNEQNEYQCSFYAQQFVYMYLFNMPVKCTFLAEYISTMRTNNPFNIMKPSHVRCQIIALLKKANW